MARSVSFAGVVLIGLCWVGSALADPSEADRATARSLAGEGYQALQSKDYATAADRFGRADALVHAPTLMIDWARSLAGLGKLVEAQERYEQIVREGVEPKAPRSWQRALTDAGNELAALKPRLAWVTISVPHVEDPRVTIDGEAVPVAAIGVRRAANPGVRLVRVQATGYLPQKRSLDLKEGGEESTTFELEPDPDQQAAAAAAEPTDAPPPTQADEPKPTLMYVAFGVAGAGLVFGGVTGAIWLGKRSELSDACDGLSRCASDQQGNIDSYHTYGTLSGVGFGVGVVAAGAGVALWLLNRHPSPQPAQGLTIQPYFAGTSLGATGSF